MDFLYNYPDWMIFVIIVAAITAIGILVMRVVHRIFPIDGTKESFDIALRVMASVVAMNTFMLAFSVVQARSHLQAIEQDVDREAKALGELDRLLVRFDDETTEPAREMLARYAKSVVEDDWPAMSSGAESPKAHQLGHDLTNAVAQLQPGTPRQRLVYAELLRTVNVVEAQRDSRLAGMRSGLPALFWAVILTMTFFGMVTGGLFKPRPMTILMVGMQSAAMGLMIAFLFVLDEPFLGDPTVTSVPFERLVQTLSIDTH